MYMNIKFSGFFIFLLLLICLVISVILGRQTIIEKLTVEKPPLMFYGVDNHGNKNGLIMELVHKKNESYSFIKIDTSMNTFLFNGGNSIGDTTLIKKLINDLGSEDVEVYLEEGLPDNIIYMLKNKCQLYIGVDTDTISYLTLIEDLTNTKNGPIDPIDDLKRAAENVVSHLKDQQEKQTTCGSANCCGNCPNCGDKVSSNLNGNTLSFSKTAPSTNMDELTKTINNVTQSGNVSGNVSGILSDKYILKTSIFPIDCPNCNTIHTNNEKGNTHDHNSNATTTTKSPTKTSQVSIQIPQHNYYDNSYKINSNRDVDSAPTYNGSSEYANSMNYYGALPERESSNFIPITSSFSAFSK